MGTKQKRFHCDRKPINFLWNSIQAKYLPQCKRSTTLNIFHRQASTRKKHIDHHVFVRPKMKNMKAANVSKLTIKETFCTRRYYFYLDIDQHQRQPQLPPLFNFMGLFWYTSTAPSINLCACNEDYLSQKMVEAQQTL